ncbi:hypothetical protein JG687_00016231 [Phytophthora cactorum]|uniref:Uncharacterized protein n=1 Tax=Phytophthora cactorum TaxID=29920 RepID=A0A329SD33_9STRA|nr:Alpha/Beta hydrolase fold [Phytophthora cactorum]KAG2759795.1 hypothetical protein Pcac1_g28193 [Phytophthora cactorum]KAG2812117.1 hypothetical protein PC112_g15319 [Phytophthora cactorum]KAG2823601.1 hypothetical protein PC111_g10166 [Phytophthora cactorum]KAG2855740.1 hypothetical protein PC113_g12199 [Phytophthora cactorum]
MPSRFSRVTATVTALLALSSHVDARSLKIETSPDWPSLQFHFTVKRSSMNVYGQADFSMLANPIVSDDSSHVLYDVFSTFPEDSSTTNYTLLNGVGYLSCDLVDPPAVECLDSESDMLPPINEIAKAINEATAVRSSSGECSNGLFKASVNGISFALCASGSSGFTMTGRDLDIAVKYLETRVDIVEPTVVDTCKSVTTASSVTPIGESLLTGTQSSIQVERNLKAEFDFDFWNDDSSSSSDGSCSCKSTKRPCLFIHGMGVDEEKPGVVDSFSYYWGNLTDHAPCCSSFKYTVLNTVDNAWTNDTLQQQVCDRAVSVSKRSSKTVIADTIIITHSMGNLMVAGAIATGKCSLDSSSTWVGLAGPMQGSMASDFVQDTCAGETNFLLEKVANVTGRCPPTVALQALPSQGGNYSSDELNAAYTAAQEAYTKNVSALMCSGGYSGLPSKYQAEFWILGSVVPYKSDHNDGMVEFDSCAAGIPTSKFGDTWKSKFYKTKLNHYDSEFLYGDSLLDEKKMPIKWFECLL